MTRETTVKKRPVVMYPAFENINDLLEQYHRLRWYIPENSPYEVYLLHDPALKVNPREIHASVPEYLDDLDGSGSNLHLLKWSRPRFLALASGSASVCLWKTQSAGLLDKLSVLTGRRFAVVDPTAKDTSEFARYATFLFDHQKTAEKNAMRFRSKERLLRASLNLRDFDKAYVFGTGPSLGRATEFDYSDGVRIVCNSIVRNPELLDHIKPHFIAAADFVYHYGPSRYAAEFRRDLLNALKRTDAYFLVPDQLAPLMFQHFPQLEARTIAVPITNQYDFRENRKGVNVQLLHKFQVRSLDSVFNLLMLPLASTLADQIYVLGCDGRKPSDKAFWAHHSASQYSGLMQTVNDTHPGFFDVDYVDYYDRYCAHVASVIASGESLGKTYASLAPSFVPALSERTAFVGEVLQMVGAA